MNALQDQSLSTVADNQVDNIDRIFRLVSKCVVTKLPNNSNNENSSLSIAFDYLSNFRFSKTQTKTIFSMIFLNATYPNELTRLFGEKPQAFKTAIQELIRKGFVEEVSTSELIEHKKKYLIRKLNTTPEYKIEKIKFYSLKPAEYELFKQLTEVLKEQIEDSAIKVIGEAKAFTQVLKQINLEKEKEAETEQLKIEDKQHEKEISKKIDNLIVQYPNDISIIKAKFCEFAPQFPRQRKLIASKLRRLEERFYSKDDRWTPVLEQAKRSIGFNITEKTKSQEVIR